VALNRRCLHGRQQQQEQHAVVNAVVTITMHIHSHSSSSCMITMVSATTSTVTVTMLTNTLQIAHTVVLLLSKQQQCMSNRRHKLKLGCCMKLYIVQLIRL
jgi:hypothetical protein